jgi:hypothetical protein
MARVTIGEIIAPVNLTGTYQLPKRPGMKAAASRSVARLLGRTGTRSVAVRVFGGVSLHPFNLIPKPPEAGSSRPLIDRALGKAGLPTYWEPKKSVGGPPQFTTRTERIQSRGGEHTASSRTPGTRKSMRGPSAQKRKVRRKTTVRRRDEEEYFIDSEGTRRYRKLR